MKTTSSTVRLTQYSHGAGCGCKIAPSVLSEMLHTTEPAIPDERLLVGNSSRDDAAVYDMQNGTGIISTTDFFMPIVDDPFTFGKIAAVNAISDVYAMGGTPLIAIAILGWPIDKLGPDVAQQVLEGGRAACREAGISLAGGHSIDSPEPIFGLAVTGTVELSRLKQNDTAKEGCLLYLTKPLGVGILTTAQKKGLLKEEDAHLAPESMTKLNSIGAELSVITGVKAMTDVTGFGLLGHLTEMCEGSGLSAEIRFQDVPRIPGLDYYIAEKSFPGGTNRNWNSYGDGIQLNSDEERILLCDPQTSGGLLIAVQPDSASEVEQLLLSNGIQAKPFGVLKAADDVLIRVL